MKIYKLTLLIVAIAFPVNSVMAKSQFNSQIPNGAVNSCATCHVSNTNYAFNPFGSAIDKKYVKSGKVTWNAELANLDSDGDGYSNGQELQDPDGAWAIGMAAPGETAAVSNPGVKTSVPTSVDDFSNNKSSNVTIFPNPFNISTTISFDVPTYSFVKANIYDLSGRIIKVLRQSYSYSGIETINWDAKDNFGNKVNSGAYLLTIEISGRTVTRKIFLVD